MAFTPSYTLRLMILFATLCFISPWWLFSRRGTAIWIRVAWALAPFAGLGLAFYDAIGHCDQNLVKLVCFGSPVGLALFAISYVLLRRHQKLESK